MGGISKMKKSVKTARLLFNIGIVLLMLVTFVSGVSHAETTKSPEFKELVFAGGPAGGNWYGLAGSISELIKNEFPELLVSVMPGGGVGNATVVEKGIAQVGLCMSFLYNSALKGDDPYTEVHKNIRGIITVGTSDEDFFLVKDKIPINSIKDLIDKKYPLRLTTSSKASTSALAAARIFEQYGITFDDLKSGGGSVIFTSYADAVLLIEDGHADAIIAPILPAVIELLEHEPMKWFPLDEKVVDQLDEQYGYSKNFVPKGKYNFNGGDAWTIAGGNIIIVNTEVPEEIVYGVTKLICENPKIIRNWGSYYIDFDPKTAWKNVGGPFHPGAEHYYRDAGYIK